MLKISTSRKKFDIVTSKGISSIPCSIPAKMPFIDLGDKNMTDVQNTRIKQLESALTFESRHYNNS